MPFTVFETMQANERFHRFTFSVSRLPTWARMVLAIPLIPGILLVGLSIVLFFVSLLALLILTAPVYVLLKWMTGTRGIENQEQSTGVKRVEATVRDA